MGIGEGLLRFKQQGLQLYRNYEKWITALIKFIAIAMGITIINQNIGALEILKEFYVVIGLSLIGMFLPAQGIVLGGLAMITVHLFSFHFIMGAISVIVSLILYILVIRLYPKQSIFIVIMMGACAVGGSYGLVMIVSLFGGIGYLAPLVAGIVGYHLWQFLEVAMQSNILSLGTTEMLQYILDNILRTLSTNTEMYASIIIGIIVYITIYAIKKQKIDYAPYLAISIGGAMNILGIVFAILFLDIELQVVSLLVLVIVSSIICMVCEYLVRPADYARAEVVQFEDDDHYYYVKVIPKISTVSNKTHIEKVYTGEM